MSLRAAIEQLSQSLETLADMASADDRLSPDYRRAYLHVTGMVRDWCRRELQNAGPVDVADLEAIQRQLAPMRRQKPKVNN